MKTRSPLPPVAELLEDENSPNITKRKLVVAITKELADEAAARAAKAEETGEPVEEKEPLSQLEVLAVIQKTLDHISEAMATNQKVELRNFGVFEVKIRKARVGRNPNRPEVDVPIPQRAVVKFKAGKEMREAVLKLTPGAVQAKKKVVTP
jgi:nucleoid DNA-binding protein